MSLIEIGCCGAYCGTCKVLKEQLCGGCKLGYKNNKRDITKAKCKTKVCCINKNYNSCADCPDTSTCQTIIEFYEKEGYKYAKYRQAIEFIKHNDYDEFIKIADTWTNAYGKY